MTDSSPLRRRGRSGPARWAALSLAGALLLAACGGDDGDDSGADGAAAPAASAGADLSTTIKILAPSYTETSQADWQKVIDGFNGEYPNVTVELQIEAWDGFTDKVQARIQGQDAPDILNDNNFADYANSDILYPIDEVMSPETLASIEPALLKNGVGEDGTQWAAPDIASARLLAYNTELFEQAGITSPPKTWDELLDAATKISELGGGVSGYGMPLGQEEAQVEASLWVWGNGGDWVSGSDLTVASEQNVAAFEQMKRFIDAKATQPDPGASNRQAVADLFNQGKLGMYVSHPGLLAETRSKFPDVKFEVAPMPTKDGSATANLGVTDFIEAFDNGDEDRKAATKAFLDYLYQPEVYGPWAAGTGLLPVTSAAIAEKSASDVDNKPFYDVLSTVRFLPQGNPNWTALQNALQQNAGQIATKPAQEVLSGIEEQANAGG
ncbi:extracellular solute-binding protein [Motilibacter aurantiacus]|uniref:extracellular solute-binding protein n=1 Tax=Motilibacter aurantiacus TaxID=2714955 RepID=UPI0014099702|nr:extracellular solute-binding protein [Motilibacter aurantiacus]NHC44504.1 extracellular solute-binding protein [Motilibacter aurantiacus]